MLEGTNSLEIKSCYCLWIILPLLLDTFLMIDLICSSRLEIPLITYCLFEKQMHIFLLSLCFMLPHFTRFSCSAWECKQTLLQSQMLRWCYFSSFSSTSDIFTITALKHRQSKDKENQGHLPSCYLTDRSAGVWVFLLIILHQWCFDSWNI